MNRIAAMLMLLAGCASQPDGAPEVDESNAVEDFVQINDLQEVDKARTNRRFEYDYITDHYVIIYAGRDAYLAQFIRRCPAVRDVHMRAHAQPDIRHDAKTLQAGVDTIRGCRIKHIYEIDKAQALELEQIGVAPGERKTNTG